MTEYIEQRMRDLAPWEHINIACDLLEEYDKTRHPSALDKAKIHCDLAHMKMIGATRA